MCNVVYLTVHRGDRAARTFSAALASALRARRIEVVEEYSFDFFNFWKRHCTYGIALAFDFYSDGQRGSGLTLNRNCSPIGRDFAYELCNAIDRAMPTVIWRDFQFVKSDDRQWFRYFNRVSSNIKSIFHLCNKRIEQDWDVYNVHFEQLVQVFTDEIVRCLRSRYDPEEYRKRVRAVKLRISNNN